MISCIDLLLTVYLDPVRVPDRARELGGGAVGVPGAGDVRPREQRLGVRHQEQDHSDDLRPLCAQTDNQE